MHIEDCTRRCQEGHGRIEVLDEEGCWTGNMEKVVHGEGMMVCIEEEFFSEDGCLLVALADADWDADWYAGGKYGEAFDAYTDDEAVAEQEEETIECTSPLPLFLSPAPAPSELAGVKINFLSVDVDQAFREFLQQKSHAQSDELQKREAPSPQPTPTCCENEQPTGQNRREHDPWFAEEGEEEDEDEDDEDAHSCSILVLEREACYRMQGMKPCGNVFYSSRAKGRGDRSKCFTHTCGAERKMERKREGKRERKREWHAKYRACRIIENDAHGMQV
jgi:hypothetical protein